MKTVFTLCLFTAFFSLAFINESTAQIGPGLLDPNFGSGGEVTDTTIFPFLFSSMALASDGSIYVTSGSSDSIAVRRYTSGGVKDSTFGTRQIGISTYYYSGFVIHVNSSFIQSDGKIVFAGSKAQGNNGSQGFVGRMDTNGFIDSSFGTNGFTYFTLYPHFGEEVVQVSPGSGGKILALDHSKGLGNAGIGTFDTLSMVSLTPAGSLDNSFGTGGYYHIPFYNYPPTGPFFFNYDANSNINFIAYSNIGGTNNIYWSQLNSNGTVNGNFGQGGSVMIDSTNIINGGTDLGFSFQSDGKLITVQTAATGAIQCAVCRYNTDGSIDENFGVFGLSNVAGPENSVPFDIHHAVQDNYGKIVMAGTINIGGWIKMVISRLNADGTTDNAFGTSGSTVLNCYQWDDFVYGLIIQPDNNILIDGFINENHNEWYDLARILGPFTNESSGINDITAEHISAYPIPTSGNLNVVLPKGENGQLMLRDITGQVLVSSQTGNALTQTVGMESFPAGIYLLSYQNNQASVSIKVVKQ